MTKIYICLPFTPFLCKRRGNKTFASGCKADLLLFIHVEFNFGERSVRKNAKAGDGHSPAFTQV